jgi:PilZ domain
MYDLLERLKNGFPVRLNRFRRMMFVEIAVEKEEKSRAVTSNLSARGMAVICDADLHPGDEASIRIGAQAPIMAQVVWRKGRRLGFRFEREVDIVQCLGARVTAQRLVCTERADHSSEEGWRC